MLIRPYGDTRDDGFFPPPAIQSGDDFRHAKNAQAQCVSLRAQVFDLLTPRFFDEPFGKS